VSAIAVNLQSTFRAFTARAAIVGVVWNRTATGRVLTSFYVCIVGHIELPLSQISGVQNRARRIVLKFCEAYNRNGPFLLQDKVHVYAILCYYVGSLLDCGRIS
jgi:hypothetical protein